MPAPQHGREPERWAPLLVLGNRTFSEEVADVAAGAGFAVAGYVENLDRSRCGDRLGGLPFHWVDELATSPRRTWRSAASRPVGVPARVVRHDVESK